MVMRRVGKVVLVGSALAALGFGGALTASAAPVEETAPVAPKPAENARLLPPGHAHAAPLEVREADEGDAVECERSANEEPKAGAPECAGHVVRAPAPAPAPAPGPAPAPAPGN